MIISFIVYHNLKVMIHQLENVNKNSKHFRLPFVLKLQQFRKHNQMVTRRKTQLGTTVANTVFEEETKNEPIMAERRNKFWTVNYRKRKAIS